MRIQKIIPKSFLMIVLCSLIMQNCKFSEEIDKDPNNPKTAPINGLLTPAELLISYTWGGNMSRYNGMFVQQLEGVDRQPYGIYNYTFLRSDVDDPWDNLYRALLSSRDVITLANTSSPYYSGIAKVISAFALGSLTSHWGDVPYSEAIKGDLGNIQPKFDNQQDVYTTIQILLDEAIVELGAPSSVLAPSIDDVIYGGDLGKWIAAAQALKARYYLQTAKKDASGYTKALDIINSNGLLTTSTSFSDFKLTYSGASALNQAPWYQWNDQRGDILPNKVYLDSLLINQDTTRAKVYMVVTTANGVDGFGDYLVGTTGPVIMLASSELYFIAAEAYFQTGQTSDAVTALNNGIATSFAETGASGSPKTYSISTISLNAIMTQKWLASWLSPESLIDWRRTGFPEISPVDGVAIPRRYAYPQKELNYNGANIPSEGGTPYLYKMWIDP